MNRNQKILQYVATRNTPATLADIVGALDESEIPSRLCTVVAAQLHQLVKAGKLARTGQQKNYSYTATPTSLIDGRRVQTPKNTQRRCRQRTATATQRADKEKPTPARAATRNTERRPFVQTLVRTPARPAGTYETVEEFVARGGRIQVLSHGELSTSQPTSMQDMNAVSWRGRQSKLRDQSQDTDADDLADAA